ncbi:hypothetical protein DFR70_13028 [Nocardia tenerifensis]|uniref:Uncharacterized protein n=1 Tax=Nocardia tenerifensis TaxID=228006 RepID=A0A318JS28_9NOCA|nr:hypothetical protein [Nocardia tenerifensis]PXX52780.1 hypothetical protein DFR70_13028 [Nocardia tenerifensis]
MTDELRLFEPVPAALRSSDAALIELCSDTACGLRPDHPGDHARLSVRGTVVAIWPAVQLTERRVAALAQLLAASAALVAAAENAEAIATNIRVTHGDDPVLRRLTALFLRKMPRWDYLPVMSTSRPGREWRELLEDAARGLGGTTDWSAR